MNTKTLSVVKLEQLIYESSNSKQIDNTVIDSDCDDSVHNIDFVPNEKAVKDQVKNSLKCTW